MRTPFKEQRRSLSAPDTATLRETKLLFRPSGYPPSPNHQFIANKNNQISFIDIYIDHIHIGYKAKGFRSDQILFGAAEEAIKLSPIRLISNGWNMGFASQKF